MEVARISLISSREKKNTNPTKDRVVEKSLFEFNSQLIPTLFPHCEPPFVFVHGSVRCFFSLCFSAFRMFVFCLKSFVVFCVYELQVVLEMDQRNSRLVCTLEPLERPE